MMQEPPDQPDAAETEAGDAQQRELQRRIARKEVRKLKARREGDRSVWFGLGSFGLIGWSVAVPTLIGVAIGLWLDSQWPNQRISWTLTLLVLGVALGCLNAWNWVKRESTRR